MTTGRRRFLEASALCGLATLLHTESFANLAVENVGKIKSELALPTFPQMEWQDCELGILFEFDISIATHNIHGDNNIRKTYNPQDYDPVKLDTDQWVETAKNAGAKYAIFTATHFGGFLQWQSDLYPYGLKQAKWKNGKGDIVGDFIQSCYKCDIKPGLYLSTHRNAYWHVDNHYVDWGHGKGTGQQREYNHICEKMTEELCSRYGRLLQIWYDAGVKTPAEGGPNVLPIFEKYQPNSIFYNSAQREDVRWIGNEGGYASYPCWATMPGSALPYNSLDWDKFIGSGAAEGGVWAPAMVDVPLRGARGVHSWFWQPNQKNGVYSPQQLMKIYEQSVGRNCNMVIGPTINPDGRIPEKDAQSLREFGKILQEQFSHPLGSTKGEGGSFMIHLKESQLLRQYVLQEDIQFGERVRSYLVKGQLTNGDWTDIDKGSCIGHKKIQKISQISQPDKFNQVALHITSSKGTPFIRNFTIF